MFGSTKSASEKRQVLRSAIRGSGLVRAPGVVDPLSAMLVEKAGFQATYVTGGGIARSLSFPDIGLVSVSEMLDRVRRIASAVDIPVIVDMDTGYGNAINAMRTIRDFEDAGAAAVHIEDQITPKKCGHYDRKALVSDEEMVLKIEAVLEARRDPNLIVIARTDARAIDGLDAAITRSKAYVTAGADMIFLEAPVSFEEMKAFADAVRAPLLFNVFGGGKTPSVPIADLESIGCRIAIFPSHLQRASIKAMQKSLRILAQEKLTDGEDPELMVSFGERDALVGLDEFDALEDRFLRLKVDP